MFIVNVEAAIFHQGKWLMIERSLKEEHAGGTLSLVGGKADMEGQSLDVLERTVRREVFEEVGIELAEPLRYVYNSSFVTDAGVPVINIVFLCTHSSGIAYAKSPDEVEATHWLREEEIMEHPKAPPWTKESVSRAAALLRGLELE